ncbi:MAG: glycosyltransferase family 4 protein [Deltaproteobacteria bacterium]|nr:glycosyltransferase family 4 protein [Deltaproteobacteria bacterium]
MILYVVRYHPALSETFVRDEAAGLHALGLPIELAAFDRREAIEIPLSFPLHAQPHRWGWLPWLPRLLVEWLRRPGLASPRVLWLAALVRRARHVHVHFAGEAALWAQEACARAGVPYTLTVHAADLFKPLPGLGAILGAAREVLTVSAHNQALIAEQYHIATRLVRMGVRLPPSPAPPSTPPTLLFAGRNVPKKGLDTLLEAARGLDRPARVVVYSNLAAQEAVEVRGLRPHEEILSAMASATALVLPCRRAEDGDMDGIPVVLIEAMARGLPVVTTAVSGLGELVDEGVGWVVPPGDPAALRVAMQAVLDNPEEARRRGAAGRQRVVERGFTREVQLAAMREVFSA